MHTDPTYMSMASSSHASTPRASDTDAPLRRLPPQFFVRGVNDRPIARGEASRTSFPGERRVAGRLA